MMMVMMKYKGSELPQLRSNPFPAAPHYNKNQQRPPTSPEVEAVLRTNLSLEYDFYNFLKQRLIKQYLELPVT